MYYDNNNNVYYNVYIHTQLIYLQYKYFHSVTCIIIMKVCPHKYMYITQYTGMCSEDLFML